MSTDTDTDANVLVRYLRELSVPGSPGDQAADTIERLTREIQDLRLRLEEIEKQNQVPKEPWTWRVPS